MSDDFSSDANAAFDKLTALKRRYQQESDPVPELAQTVRIEPDNMDNDDIPVLTQAVMILDEAPVEAPGEVHVEAMDVLEPDQTSAVAETDALRVLSAEDILLEKLIQRLQPELESIILQTVQAVLEGRESGVYEAWLAGLRRRTAHLLDEGEDNTSSSWL